MKFANFNLTWVFVSLVTAAAASGESIPIANHSFEEPAFPPGVYENTIQDWTQYEEPGFSRSSGTWHVSIPPFGDLSALDGLQSAYVWGPERIAQQLTTEIVLGATYQLSALLGSIVNPAQVSGGSLELWAGGNVANGDVVGGTMLGALVVADEEVPLGSFKEFSATIVAPTTGVSAGDLLAIRFVANRTEAEIDNIRLDFVVPEPSVATLLWTALCGLIFLGRRLA